MLKEFQSEQKIACQIMLNSVLKNKIGHAYLIESNGYDKKNEITLSFAKLLLCPNHYTDNQKCNNCSQCQNIDKNIFSELKIIEPDGLWIKKEQLEELQKEFSTKSILANRKVYIIKQADRLNTQAANSILKFLEEPEDNITAILVTDNMYQILNTILSRCQIITLKSVNKYNNTNMLNSIKHNIQFEIEDEKLSEIIEKIIEFIKYYEKNKINTILKTQKLWHNFIKEKNEIMLGIQLMILFYKDVINYKIKEKIEIFLDYKNEIVNISNQNTISNLNKKIQILLKTKDKINYNINSQLLMDKLIIELERCDQNG